MATLCHTQRKNHRELARTHRQLRRHPRPHRTRRPRLSPIQQASPRTRRLLSPQPPAPRQIPSTPSKKAHFTIHPIAHHDTTGNKLLLMTIRSHDQFNTSVYGNADRYRGISHGRRVILLNQSDMDRLGLQKDQWVDITSHFENVPAPSTNSKSSPTTSPSNVPATYFPKPIPSSPLRYTVDGSNQPASKSLTITLIASSPPKA